MSRLPVASWVLAVSVSSSSLVACDEDPGGKSSFVVHTNTRPDVVADVVADTQEDVLVDDVLDAASTTDTSTGTSTTDTSTSTTDTSTTDTSTSATDTATTDTTTTDTATGPTGPVDINTDWIGGACTNTADCDYEGGQCLTSGDGWPAGTCTQACTRFCPDQAGSVTTFCIDGDEVGEPSGGLCVTKCDFGESPTGCRAGYHCVAQTRFNEPAVMAYVCLPGEGELEVSSCIDELIAKGIGFELASNPMDEPANAEPGDVCDVMDPIYVDPVIDGVRFRPSDFTNEPRRMFVQCPVALALWHTAQLAKSRGITDIVHYGTYNCRYISGTTSLSEHAFANAIDLAGFQTSDGARYTLLADWDTCDPTPEAAGAELLYWLAHSMYAQGVWNIILTPEYNAAHDDHFHVDLTPGGDFLSDCQ